MCEIKWIDEKGNPTIDTNEPIGKVRCKAHVSQIGGRGIQFADSEWFTICAEHAKRLNDPGMERWEFVPN